MTHHRLFTDPQKPLQLRPNLLSTSDQLILLDLHDPSLTPLPNQFPGTPAQNFLSRRNFRKNHHLPCLEGSALEGGSTVMTRHDTKAPNREPPKPPTPPDVPTTLTARIPSSEPLTGPPARPLDSHYSFGKVINLFPVSSLTPFRHLSTFPQHAQPPTSLKRSHRSCFGNHRCQDPQ